MKIASLIAGLLAVALYLLCFQLKHAKSIIVCKLISSVLYVLQYLLLFAFVGAAMDAAAFLASAIAYYKDRPFVQRFRVPILVLCATVIVTVGLLLYENVFSLLAIAGVLFESAASWMKKERMIRILCLFAVPCWGTYNVVSGAWGSAVGNVLALVSILSALWRYAREEKCENATR